jgi:hypothetical protein
MRLAQVTGDAGHVEDGLWLVTEARVERPRGRVTCWRTPIGSRGNTSWSRRLQIRPRRLPASSRPRPGNCAPQGKRVEAHALVAPIYGWCTEGFDTADLQEAKALLEELAG